MLFGHRIPARLFRSSLFYLFFFRSAVEVRLSGMRI